MYVESRQVAGRGLHGLLGCVGRGLIGVIRPGLPISIFLIAASYLFTRSSPALNERVHHIRVLRLTSYLLPLTLREGREGSRNEGI